MIVQTGELTVRSYKTKTPITPPFAREVAFRSDNAYPQQLSTTSSMAQGH